MKKILYILFATSLALAGCTREEPGHVNVTRKFESTLDTTGRVLVQFEVSIPTLTPQTKALGETPSGDLDKMYLAVFGRSGYLKEYVEATITPATTNGKVNETDKENGVLLNRYTISATLALSENSERHIHFLGNGPTTMEFGQETDLIPNLMSPEGKGGYWQYAILPGIKAKRNRDVYTTEQLNADPTIDPDAFILQNGFYVLHDDTAAYFADVPLIRNFSKIVVEDMDGSNFITHSFAAVNIATSGSIAPYYSAGFIQDYQSKSYVDLLSDLKYPALLPLNATFNDDVPSATAFQNIGAGVAALNGSVYMYERPIPDDDQKPTSVIIYGHFTDPDTEDGDDSGDYYYKVDLMDANGYYPIYRNFKYRIQIREILRPGTTTPEDAIRAMGSGDISADIATQNLTDISDGTSHILVSFMNKTLIHQYPYTDDNETVQLTLLYKYIPNVSADVNNDGEADWNNTLVENGGPVTITLQTMADNPIITGYTVGDTDDANGFRTITITTSQPLGYLRTQYIQIKGTHTVTHEDPNTGGTSTTATTLYRNVTFSMISTQTMTVTCSPARIPKGAGEEITVNISIPKDLPSSMFPLAFYLEAERLSLTPDNTKPNNNLPVQSGNSIYDTGEPAFHFIRTVTEAEYLALSASSNTTTVTIPCYFKTNMLESASNIRVKDEKGYFTTGDTYFRNIGSQLQFKELSFPNGINKAISSYTDFTFKLDDSDDLPEKVYLKFSNVRPLPSSGLSMVTDPEDAYHGWYWYSPAVTANSDLQHGYEGYPRYQPVVKLATQDATGIAQVWLEAPEYVDAYMKYEIPATGISIEGNATRNLILRVPNKTTADLVATLTPYASTDVVTWTSSNTGVATVDANGHLTAVAVGNTTITATARQGVSASVTVNVRELSFSNLNFYNANNGSVITSVSIGNNQDVWFRFDYDSEYYGSAYPVTFTLTNLTTADDRLVSNGNGSYTFTPTDNNTTQYVHLKTSTRFNRGTVAISHPYYATPAAKTVNRSLLIMTNELLAKGYDNNNPTKLTTSTNVIMSTAQGSGDLVSNIRFNNSFNNTSNISADISDGVDENTRIYFRYVNSNNTYYDHDSITLDDLAKLREGTLSSVTLHFYRWVTGTYSIDFTNSSNTSAAENGEINDSSRGIVIQFTNSTEHYDGFSILKRNYRLDVGSNNSSGTITVSVNANSPLVGCKLTSATFTYFKSGSTTYNSRNVTASPGTMSGKTNWSASSSGEGNGDTLVTFTMANGNPNNAITNLSIGYGYWDF